MYSLSVSPFLKSLPNQFYYLSEKTGDEIRGSIGESVIAFMNRVKKPQFKVFSHTLHTLQDNISEAYTPIYTGLTLSLANLEPRAKRVKDLVASFHTIRDNWDGEGAKAPSSTTINNALRFLSLLEEKKLSFPAYEDVQIMPYGSIVFDVNTVRGLISIEIGQTKMGYFTDFNEGDNYGSEGVSFIEGKMPEDLALLLS